MSESDAEMEGPDAGQVAEALEARTPEPPERWRRALGAALELEGRRRAIVGPRPSMLWLRAGALIALGALLLGLGVSRI
ncbi:hypothetical protein [Paraconexibacter sp.]|uniref:hypothetical protein n=1 Tax=Paraconexibacter sp. TaxID=2949640 RepID=UPI00356AC9D6